MNENRGNILYKEECPKSILVKFHTWFHRIVGIIFLIMGLSALIITPLSMEVLTNRFLALIATSLIIFSGIVLILYSFRFANLIIYEKGLSLPIRMPYHLLPFRDNYIPFSEIREIEITEDKIMIWKKNGKSTWIYIRLVLYFIRFIKKLSEKVPVKGIDVKQMK